MSTIARASTSGGVPDFGPFAVKLGTGCGPTSQASAQQYKPKRRNSLTSFLKPQKSGGLGPGSAAGGGKILLKSCPPGGGGGANGQSELGDQMPQRRSSLPFGSSSFRTSRGRAQRRRGSLSSVASMASTATGDSSAGSSVLSFAGLRHKSLDRLIEKKKWKKVAKKLETPEGRAEAASSSMSARWSDSVGAMGMSTTNIGESWGEGAYPDDYDQDGHGDDDALLDPDLHCSADFSVVSVCDGEESDDNSLHKACAKAAPLDVVRTLCEICPDLAVEVDDHSRTALHLAAASPETYPEAVHYLLGFNGGSAFARDADGRLPLHMACRRPPRVVFGSRHTRATRRLSWAAGSGPSSSSSSSDPLSSRPPRIISLTVVRLLLDAAPFAVNHEDSEGLIPAEHVLMAGGCGDFSGMDNVRILEYLLRKSRKLWSALIEEEGESAKKEREAWIKRRTRSMRCAMESDEKAEAEERMSLRKGGMGTLGEQQAVLAELRRGRGGFETSRDAGPRRETSRLRQLGQSPEDKGKTQGNDEWSAPKELECDMDRSQSSISCLGLFDTMAPPGDETEVERKMEELAKTATVLAAE